MILFLVLNEIFFSYFRMSFVNSTKSETMNYDDENFLIQHLVFFSHSEQSKWQLRKLLSKRVFTSFGQTRNL